jgi:hypothetical protein
MFQKRCRSTLGPLPYFEKVCMNPNVYNRYIRVFFYSLSRRIPHITKDSPEDFFK